MPAAPDPMTLLGPWHFDRTIDDRAAGDAKSAEGTITLGAEDGPARAGAPPEAAGTRVRWSERGTLRIAGQELEVFRTMFVVPRGGGWFVLFEDGHDFHPWTAGEDVRHLCGADMYRGRIALDRSASGGGPVAGEGPASVDGPPADAAPAAWTVRWDVRGPAKDYTMITRLRR